MFAPRTILSALALAAAVNAIPTSVDQTSVVPTSVVPASAAVPTAASTPAPANLHPHSFEVYDPPITSPRAGDVWTAGQNQTVTWDVSKIGSDGHNTTASLLLGHREPGTLNEYLDIRHPLASDFAVDAGLVSFIVPDGVLSASNYIVVLVGSISDSGNASPQFTINNPDEPSLTGVPSSASSDVPVTPPPTSVPTSAFTSVSTDDPATSVETSTLTASPASATSGPAFPTSL